MTPHIEITVFTKAGGILSKRISLSADGAVESMTNREIYQRLVCLADDLSQMLRPPRLGGGKFSPRGFATMLKAIADKLSVLAEKIDPEVRS